MNTKRRWRCFRELSREEPAGQLGGGSHHRQRVPSHPLQPVARQDPVPKQLVSGGHWPKAISYYALGTGYWTSVHFALVNGY